MLALTFAPCVLTFAPCILTFAPCILTFAPWADGDLYIHITQCRGFVMTNDHNHWILRQPDQVSKTDTMARGTRGPICGNQWVLKFLSFLQLFSPRSTGANMPLAQVVVVTSCNLCSLCFFMQLYTSPDSPLEIHGGISICNLRWWCSCIQSLTLCSGSHWWWYDN